jgi:hypothetical protein
MIFDSIRDNNEGLFAVREGSSEPFRLTSGPLKFYSPVTGSNANTLYALGGQARGDLTRFSPSSNRFDPFMGGQSADMLDFSASHDVVYVSYPEGGLWTAAEDGTKRRELIPPWRMRVSLPKWSPDGKSILFSGTTDTSPWSLYTMSANGENLKRIETGDPLEVSIAPQWSPDGESILYTSFREPGANPISPFSFELRILHLQSGQVETIEDSSARYNQRWWPDGGAIVATDAENRTLLRFDLSRRRWTPILHCFVTWPQWSGDGHFLYFECRQNGRPAACRMRASDLSVETITALERFPRARRTDFGLWLGFTPDGLPVALRDASSFQVYALHVKLP